MDKGQKVAIIEKLRDLFKKSSSVVAVHQNTLKVSETQSIRKKLRENSSNYFVAKNTLVKIAVKDTDYDNISSILKGQVALVFSDDFVAGPKVVTEFAAKSAGKLSIIGGLLAGKLLSAKDVDSLAKLPSLDELRGRLIGVIQAPARQIAVIASEPAAKIARVTQAYANK